ncbi:MAG: hypothetical protein CL678_16025 [Bdellovibrionaceae bacterium]|nr:hypothetical protein [Pseudobdellovibrionaceae bacterium]
MVFYRNGRVGFPMGPRATSVSDHVHIEDDISSYFTPDGFYYPIRNTGPAISDILNNRVPFISHPRLRFLSAYIHVNKEGLFCQVTASKALDNEVEISMTDLPMGQRSYLISSDDCNARDSAVGAMLACKTEEDFQKLTNDTFVLQGREIVWMSLEDLIRRCRIVWADDIKGPGNEAREMRKKLQAERKQKAASAEEK